jgi:hypothetical protein
MPSYLISFKLAAAGDTVGVLDFDGTSAVAGRIGARARTFPLTMSLALRDADRPKTFRFEVAHCGMLTPLLVATAVDAVLSQQLRMMGDQTLRTRLTISLEGRAPLTIEDASATRGDHIFQVFSIIEPLMLLSSSPLGDAPRFLRAKSTLPSSPSP